MQGFGPRFSGLYKSFVETPELAKFYRPTELWSWILNNEAAMIEMKLKACNVAIAQLRGVTPDRNVYQMTDYHCVYDAQGSTTLRTMMSEVKEMVRDYSRDLILAHDIANLPEQDAVYDRHFADHKNLFHDGLYGPTGQDAKIYQQVPPHPETCCLIGHDSEDSITELLIRYIQPVNEIMARTAQWIMRLSEAPVDWMLPKFISFGLVCKVVHCLAGVHVTVLLTGTLGILSKLSTDKHRIITLGCLNLLLMGSLILLIPSLKRKDLFSVAAAYVAVGGMFIGSRNTDCT